MKISKNQLFLWLSILATYFIILVGFSTQWFSSALNMEAYFVWWLTAVLLFLAVFRMAFKFLIDKRESNKNEY